MYLEVTSLIGKAKIKTIKVTGVLILGFFLTWFPYQVNCLWWGVWRPRASKELCLGTISTSRSSTHWMTEWDCFSGTLPPWQMLSILSSTPCSTMAPHWCSAGHKSRKTVTVVAIFIKLIIYWVFSNFRKMSSNEAGDQILCQETEQLNKRRVRGKYWDVTSRVTPCRPSRLWGQNLLFLYRFLLIYSAEPFSQFNVINVVTPGLSNLWSVSKVSQYQMKIYYVTKRTFWFSFILLTI